MEIRVVINTCWDCRYLGHSGAFGIGGAKLVCEHPDAVDLVWKMKTDAQRAKDDEDYPQHPKIHVRRDHPRREELKRHHWRYRVIKNSKKIPLWCPLKHGSKY